MEKTVDMLMAKAEAAGLIRANRHVLYVGKAVTLRNRLQGHKMWNLMEDDPTLRDSLADISVDVWYLP